MTVSVPSAGNDSPGTDDDDLASIIDMLRDLIVELRERVRMNGDDRIGPNTRSMIIDALLPEVEQVLARCPENSQVRVARTWVSGRLNREDLGGPDVELMTNDELAALVVVFKALTIEQDRRGAGDIEGQPRNQGAGKFGHTWRTNGPSEADPPRRARRSDDRRTDISCIMPRRF